MQYSEKTQTLWEVCWFLIMLKIIFGDIETHDDVSKEKVWIEGMLS